LTRSGGCFENTTAAATVAGQLVGRKTREI
jgi:hypothetical protein